MDLPDDDYDILCVYIRWVYVKGFPADITEYQDELFRMYVFADKMRSTTLKDLTMNGIQDHICECDNDLTLKNIRRTFENTANSTDSPLRMFCCAILVYNMINPWEDVSWGQTEVLRLFKEVPGLLDDYLRFQMSLSADGIEASDNPK
jgi:hypothetical protein